jgi:hypothetical protein
VITFGPDSAGGVLVVVVLVVVVVVVLVVVVVVVLVVAAGGDGPLPGSEAGSFAGGVTSAGGSDEALVCCVGIVPPVVPAVPPLPPPVPVIAPPSAAEPCVSPGAVLLAPVSDGATAPLGSGVPPPPVLGAGLVSSGPVPPVDADESTREVLTEKSCRLPALFAPMVATRSFTCGACGAASAEGEGPTAYAL